MTGVPGFSYMGTKRQIAPAIAAIISGARKGPILDAFAGVSAVGIAVGQSRPLWCNDSQFFSYNVAHAYFTASRGPRASERAIKKCAGYFATNFDTLAKDLEQLLRKEERAHQSKDVDALRRISSMLVRRGVSKRVTQVRAAYRARPNSAPYCLFSYSYAGGYVGLKQGMEIDSLRFAVDRLLWDGDIDSETHRWMMMGLCRALFRVSNSTGHFAQYLEVKQHSVHRFVVRRTRSVWHEWMKAMHEMRPFGTSRWRANNRVYWSDAVKLLRHLSGSRVKPAVVYCDPPYTRDHYSRYYHLLETLLIYDYPDLMFKGQYRPDRFQSLFSMRTQAQQAFSDLIAAVANLGSSMVLSYPSKAILPDSRNQLSRLLRQHFSKVEIAAELDHEHSTLGASKGVERSPVTELVFVAS